MTDKNDLIQRLHALADAQLTEAEQKEIHAAMQVDVTLKVQYTAIIDLKTAVSGLPREDAQPELLAAVRSRLSEIDRVSKADWFVSRYAWSLCGLVLVSIIGAGTYTRMTAGGKVKIGDVQSYNASLVGSPISGAAHGVENWIKRSLGLGQNQRVKIVQEEFGTLGGVPTARVILSSPDTTNSTLTLFVIESPSKLGGMEVDPANRRFQEGRLGSYNCVNWGQGSYQMLLIGSDSFSNLENVAGSLNVR